MYRLRRKTKKKKKMCISNLSNSELLNHFKDAVRDDHYNPSGNNCNESGFSYDELESELLSRMPNDSDDSDDDGE